MNWDQARQLLRLRRAPEGAGEYGRADRPDALASVRASSLCVVSGKGGTGKSLVTASLGQLLARTGRTLLVDADLGVGNAHILQDVQPEHCFVDVVEGRKQVREIVQPCGSQLDLLAGGSGFARMAGLTTCELELIAAGLERLERQYRFLLVDSAAGLSNQTLAFAAAADLIVLVTTPDLTAMTDAYAFLKVLVQRKADVAPLLVVNRALGQEEAQHAAQRIAQVSRKFLGREPRWISTLPEDRAAFRSAQRRKPVVVAEPDCALAGALRELAHTLLEEFGRCHAHGLGRALLQQVGAGTRRA
jgi:flagellar biosynthesis protein FlhG